MQKLDEFRAAMESVTCAMWTREIQKWKKVYERVSRPSGRNKLPYINHFITKRIGASTLIFPLYIDEEEFGKEPLWSVHKTCENDIFSGRYFYPARTISIHTKVNLPMGETPVQRRVSKKISLTLPMYADLAMEDVDRICGMILS